VAGLYDYGPTGCAIMANLISEWRQHFVLEENMLEVNCSAITPHYVLQCVSHLAQRTPRPFSF
jgi:glycyl-tRNA synthetase